MSRAFAVAALIISPQGIPLIRDPKKPAPVYWKLPGGRAEPGETPEAAAVREIKEETGLILVEDDLFVVQEEDRSSHTLVIFKAEVKKVDTLLTQGNEGEEIKVFSKDEVLSLPDLFPNHRAIIQKIL